MAFIVGSRLLRELTNYPAAGFVREAELPKPDGGAGRERALHPKFVHESVIWGENGVADTADTVRIRSYCVR